ncbi:DUF5048 domain-containing protein [Lachnospiraceae bacterium OttesenSCG-928-D06]|nr:DUF5048 domain-containing protein [Lachnospiraceae bacterium OttesenSCG-928-D06]
MKYNITETDKNMILQPIINYHYRVYITDSNGKILDLLENISDLSGFTVDGDSNIRRTFSATLSFPDKINVHALLNTWLTCDFILQIGIENIRTGEIHWYDCGTYIISQPTSMFDSNNNSVTLNFADWYSKLDGTRNGKIGGAPTVIISNRDQDNNLLTIKSVLSTFVHYEAGIRKYIIEDLGEFYGNQSNNPSKYLDYRVNNPDWDKLPHDLEFSVGDTIANIITTIVELYPNIQAYFDIYNNFCVGFIPSCEHNTIELDNDFLQQILISDNSESVTYHIQDIYNITEVFGKVYEIDRFSEKCITSENVYILTLTDYDKYQSYNKIAFTPITSNNSNMKLSINSLDSIPIYYENTTTPILSNTINANELYVVQLKFTKNGYVAYFLGQYQPHAICVLTNNINDGYYTKQYFKDKFNCSNIILHEEDSPFSVQRIGEILDVKSGNEFDNIISESVAEQNAIYYNKKSSSLNETINITVKFIPWIDILTKVTYKKAHGEKIEEYLIKNITHNIINGTSTITMSKFYPLYYD